MSVAEAAWLAGFYDGEGNLGTYRAGRDKKYLATIITINNTSLESLEFCRQISGAGTIVDRPRVRLHHKPQWGWKVTRQREVADLLRQMLPYLIIKKDKAEEHLARWTDI